MHAVKRVGPRFLCQSARESVRPIRAKWGMHFSSWILGNHKHERTEIPVLLPLFRRLVLDFGELNLKWISLCMVGTLRNLEIENGKDCEIFLSNILGSKYSTLPYKLFILTWILKVSNKWKRLWPRFTWFSRKRFRRWCTKMKRLLDVVSHGDAKISLVEIPARSSRELAKTYGPVFFLHSESSLVFPTGVKNCCGQKSCGLTLIWKAHPWNWNFPKTLKALFTRRKSEVVFSTKAMSLGVFFRKKCLVLKSRNLNSEVVFLSAVAGAASPTTF